MPICRDQWANHDHAFNLLFRIILPIFFFLFAALYTRVWPVKVLNHFERSTVGSVQAGRVQGTWETARVGCKGHAAVCSRAKYKSRMGLGRGLCGTWS